MKKNIEAEKVVELELDTILDSIIPPKDIDFFGHSKCEWDIKDKKFVATISNSKSKINVSIDMNDVAKYFGFKNWKLINICDVDYDDADVPIIDRCCYVTKVQFYNKD